MHVEFTLNARGKPPDYNAVSSVKRRKIADAAIVFEHGPLFGTRLTGFVVWQSRDGDADYSVSPPERTIVTGAQRGRTYALLRPVGVADEVCRPNLPQPITDVIVNAFCEWIKTPRA